MPKPLLFLASSLILGLCATLVLYCMGASERLIFIVSLSGQVVGVGGVIGMYFLERLSASWIGRLFNQCFGRK